MTTYAEALAHTQQMHNDLHAAHDKIAEQDVTIGRLEDRIAMLVDALDRKTYSELMLRKLLIELAVQQTNISPAGAQGRGMRRHDRRR